MFLHITDSLVRETTTGGIISSPLMDPDLDSTLLQLDNNVSFVEENVNENLANNKIPCFYGFRTAFLISPVYLQ